MDNDVTVLQAIDGDGYRLEMGAMFSPDYLSTIFTAAQLSVFQHMGFISTPGATAPSNPPPDIDIDGNLVDKMRHITEAARLTNEAHLSDGAPVVIPVKAGS